MCIMPRRRRNIILPYSTLDLGPHAYPASAVSNVFRGRGRAEGPTATRNPSSAGMRYHLSKYLDNWIWEGSQSRHCNQWHCQRCHWEPASSCTTPPQTEREGGTQADVFSAGWLSAEGARKSPGSKKRKEKNGRKNGGSECLPSNDASERWDCPRLPKEWQIFLALRRPCGIKKRNSPANTLVFFMSLRTHFPAVSGAKIEDPG